MQVVWHEMTPNRTYLSAVTCSTFSFFSEIERNTLFKKNPKKPTNSTVHVARYGSGKWFTFYCIISLQSVMADVLSVFIFE